MTTDKFVEWLTSELEERLWSYSDLAKVAGTAPQTISQIASGYYKAGYNVCIGIARAFKLPPEDVLRRAGLLPALPAGEVLAVQVKEVVQVLPQDEQQLVLEFARWRLSRVK